MNVSHLSLAQQAKAFSDAAELNRQRAEAKTILDRHAYDQSAKTKAYRAKAIAVCKADSDLFAAEARRMQKILQAQRGG